MAAKKAKHRFLTIDELSTIVYSASCFAERGIWHRYRNPSHHFLLIESGLIEAWTKEGRFHGKAGDLFYFHPTDYNEYGNIEMTRFYQVSIRFAPPPRDRFTPSFVESGPLPVQVSLGKAFGEMRRVFETFCIETPQAGSLHLLRLRAAVHEMLAILAGVLTRDPTSPQHLDEWQRLRMRLDTELSADVPVEAMARQMNLSASYFKRAFKHRFGLAPRAYHMHARLWEAVRMLRRTDRSVKAIAYELGFSNAIVFTRLFKSQLGVSPSDIRQGTAKANEPTTSVGGRLFPMNTHLVAPPQTSEGWEEACNLP